MMKTPEDIKNALNAMSKDKRKKVESIVRRHIDACQRMGVEVEYLDRVVTMSTNRPGLSGDCGMRNAECGFKRKFLINPQSAIRN
jgi:hypothetical protein